MYMHTYVYSKNVDMRLLKTCFVKLFNIGLDLDWVNVSAILCSGAVPLLIRKILAGFPARFPTCLSTCYARVDAL